jgi:hypothetical protein
MSRVKIGLQHVDRSFCEKADARMDAGGEVVRGDDAVQSLTLSRVPVEPPLRTRPPRDPTGA